MGETLTQGHGVSVRFGQYLLNRDPDSLNFLMRSSMCQAIILDAFSLSVVVEWTASAVVWQALLLLRGEGHEAPSSGQPL